VDVVLSDATTFRASANVHTARDGDGLVGAVSIPRQFESKFGGGDEVTLRRVNAFPAGRVGGVHCERCDHRRRAEGDVFVQVGSEDGRTVAGTAPDSRYLLASRDGVTVSAWTPEDLAAEIRRETDAH
jgi:hypothetical protein